MYRLVRPQPVDFWPQRDQIMMAISKAFTPTGDLDGLREEILNILCRSAEISVSQFHDRVVQIEKKLAALDVEENSTEPPFRHLLKRFMVHVCCQTGSQPFRMVMSASDANLTTEERGMLLTLLREIMRKEEPSDKVQEQER